jgi:hypothetical protein
MDFFFIFWVSTCPLPPPLLLLVLHIERYLVPARSMGKIRRWLRDRASPVWFHDTQQRFVRWAPTGDDVVPLRGLTRWLSRRRARIAAQLPPRQDTPSTGEGGALRPSIAPHFVGRWQGSAVDSHFTALSAGRLVPPVPNRCRDTYRWREDLPPVEWAQSWLLRHVRASHRADVDVEAQALRVHPLAWQAIFALEHQGLSPLAGRVCVGQMGPSGPGFGTATDAVWFDHVARSLVVVELKKLTVPSSLPNPPEPEPTHRLQLALTTCMLWEHVLPGTRVHGVLLRVFEQREPALDWLDGLAKDLARQILAGNFPV